MRMIGLAAAAAVLALGLGKTSESVADKLKVGFVYFGPIGGYGWTYQHEAARQAVIEQFGDQIETTYLDNVTEGPSAEGPIAELAKKGCKLIFTTSFGYMDATLRVAKQFPDVHFEHATGYKRTENVSTYSARWYEGRYIQGQIAAKMSKTGLIGFIAPFPVAEVVSGINAAMLGAQSINPNIKMKIAWADSWSDAGHEAGAATALLDERADVILQHTNTAAAMQIAAQRGAFAFGQNSDLFQFGTKTQLTAIVQNWGPYYIERIKAQLDVTWKSSDMWGGLKSRMFLMAPYTNMPDGVKKMAEATEASIASGELHPFACPLIDQDGTAIECKGGTHLSDEQILTMNYYVRGIDDRLPEK
jgi:basic membrane protein A